MLLCLDQLPPTRAKSPKLGRRKSCSDTTGIDKGIGACGRGTRQSLGIYKDTSPIAKIKNGNNGTCKLKDEPKQTRETGESISPRMSGQENADGAVE